jgi:hypothetical protein
MLVELSVVEQRYQAVLAVIRDGVPIVQVARRFDVSRNGSGGAIPSRIRRTLTGEGELLDWTLVPERSASSIASWTLRGAL